MSTLTTRQQPVATEFQRQLDQLGAVAGAISDNVFEDGEPIDPDTVWGWVKQLDAIKNCIVGSTIAVQSRRA